MLRLGLCCIFREQPISFKQVTAKRLEPMQRDLQLEKLSTLCVSNLENLQCALEWVSDHQIGAFRVLSPLFPRYTHPAVGYSIDELPDAAAIRELCGRINSSRDRLGIRLSLHPDQFNVLSSPNPAVVDKTIEELEYQGVLAELIGAEVINIHGGGGYGNKTEALKRFESNFGLLSDRVKSRLTVENDDITYTPADLLPLCAALSIPLVYDVHHHRCLPDGLSVEDATEQCISSWECRGQEPYFHVSSPRDGWQAKNPRSHADYIDPEDVPGLWLGLVATVDVEAKAKELAVLDLLEHLGRAKPASAEK